MKKLFLLILVITVSFGMVYSQSITVTSPHSGQTWHKGSAYNITWTKSGSQNANVKIRLYNPAGTTLILPITDNTSNDGNYSWTVPNSVANGNYVVRVKTIDNAVYDDSDSFNIGVAPAATITVTNPHSGQTWYKGSAYNITWTKSGAQNANVKIRLFNPAGTTLILPITDNTSNDGSFSWTIPNSVASGNYVVRVKTVDNAVFDDSGMFAIDTGSGDDNGWLEWLKHKLEHMRLIEWWKVHGPRPPWPDPGPYKFDLGRLTDLLKNSELKGQVVIELFKGGSKIAELGKIGSANSAFRGKTVRMKNMGMQRFAGVPMLQRNLTLKGLSKQRGKMLGSGDGYKLVFKNMAGKVIFSKGIMLKEKVANLSQIK